LRLSLTKRCGLTCIFCHREGGLDRGRMYLDAPFFAAVANECYRLGGREINLTGGEPTMFPGLTELVDLIERPQAAKLTITTNGCDIAPLMGIQRKTALTTVNVSLHGWDRGYLAKTISRRYDRDQVCENIRALAGAFPVCVNFSLMKDNCEQFHDVAAFAIASGVQLKVINFQEISWNRKKTAGQFVLPATLVDQLAVVAERARTPLRVLQPMNGYGAFLGRYILGDTLVTIVDGATGHKAMGACQGCRHASICKEGFYAVRLYSDGTLAPCLHREDLATHYDSRLSLSENLESLLRTVQ
jgi:molybdenum cofactor biosynthesis enzyme MoaA